MRFTVITLFPEMFESALSASVFGKAQAAGLVEVDFVNPRDFALDKHSSVDDTPYGGGPGMVMKCDTLIAAIDSVSEPTSHRIALSPVGKTLNHRRVVELATESHLVLVCGRYEGIDERVIELGIDESISVGDYVLTGGELGAMVLIDAVSRFVPGVLGHSDSASEESFSEGLLEYPQYTRPKEFRGKTVPDILLSGHHEKIAQWRHQQSLLRTAQHRPDLIASQRGMVDSLAARTYVILAHHPVLDRNDKVVTTSVTNLDIHDIARSCATFGVAGYIPVSPLRLQREKIDRIIDIWRKEITQIGADDRALALGCITVSESIERALETVKRRHKTPPWVVATSAQSVESASSVGFQQLLAERLADPKRPLVLLLGTGWGLDESVFSMSNQVLTPISATSEFNHLSVRSAAAAILDRIFGSRS